MPLELNGYSARICCEGEELEQYDVATEDERTVACWIPSESGKEFTVHWAADSPTTIMDVIVLVDGRCVVRMGHLKKSTGSLLKVEDRPGQRRPLHFSQLVLTDDESVASSSGSGLKLEKLGSIEIELRRVRAYSEGTGFYSMGEFREIGPVHEKSKKAGVHAVSVGAAEKCTPAPSFHAIGLEREPFAVFMFRYRPLELLRANGIAPPLPAGKKRPLDARDPIAGGAGPSGSKRPRIDEGEDECKVKPKEDDDEVELIQEQIVMLQGRLAQAQAKKSQTVVKREVSPIRVPADWTDEIIDLT